MTETKKKTSVGDALGKLGPFIALVAICIALGIATGGGFLGKTNVLNLLRQVPIVALMAVGMLCVILLGGIDLSAGSLLAVSTGVTAVIMKNFLSENTVANSVILMIICLVVGVLAGMSNGLLLTKLHLPHPFIATLGTKNMYRGLTLVIMGSASIAGFPKGALVVGTAEPAGIPFSFILTIVVYIIMHIFLSYSPIGRKIYSFGGNEEAARLAGINTDRIQIICYSLSGFFCALAGIVYIGRLNSAVPLASQEGDLDAIASCIIGGTRMSGGKGNVWGTLVGAFFITVIRNGCNLLGVSSDLQLIVIGAIIVLAVFVDVVRGQMDAKAKRLAVVKSNG